MKRYKIFLDLIMGALIPVLVLKYGTKPLGEIPAYVIAGLIPAVYVLGDLLFYSRKVNVVTTYIALGAISSAALVFWYVDGWKYAIKDSFGSLLGVTMFGGSLLFRKPLFQFFLLQVAEFEPPEVLVKLRRLFDEPSVYSALAMATVVQMSECLLAGTINFILNLNRVTSQFPSEAFNNEKAGVDAITRILFPILSLGGFVVGYLLVTRRAARLAPNADPNDILSILDNYALAPGGADLNKTGTAPATAEAAP